MIEAQEILVNIDVQGMDWEAALSDIMSDVDLEESVSADGGAIER